MTNASCFSTTNHTERETITMTIRALNATVLAGPTAVFTMRPLIQRQKTISADQGAYVSTASISPLDVTVTPVCQITFVRWVSACSTNTFAMHVTAVWQEQSTNKLIVKRCWFKSSRKFIFVYFLAIEEC